MKVVGKIAPRSHGAGFTLLELVVVMALIAILAVGVGWALSGGDDGARLRAAEVTVGNYFQRARAEAVLRRQPVRLLVREDATDREHHRRQLGAVVRTETDPERWLALDDGVLLPPSVFCWERANANGDAFHGAMRLSFPRAQPVPQGGDESWRFLTIEADGAVRSPGLLELVIARWEPGANQPRPKGEGESHRLRLGVTRLGGLVKLAVGEDVP